MSVERFIEIWQYRARKITNISVSFYNWLAVLILVKISKLIQPNRPHIGLLLAEHFGDIVATEPFTRDLKRRYPTAKLYWIVRKPFRELVDYNPNIDVVLEEYSILESILLTKKHPFDQFYNCQMPDTRRYTYLNRLLDNPRARALGINSTTYHFHGNILESFAKAAGLPVIDVAPRMYISEAAVATVDRLALPARYVVLHCHSNFSPKDWRVAHWERLISDLIQTFRITVVEVGLKSNLTIDRKEYLNLCGQLSLLETAEVIRRAAYFIGIDSGPAHIANAVGTFGFLLFGKLGLFERYMPYSGDYQAGKNVCFIIKDGATCSELDYDVVWNTIKASPIASQAGGG